jgi:hypothetical protein
MNPSGTAEAGSVCRKLSGKHLRRRSQDPDGAVGRHHADHTSVALERDDVPAAASKLRRLTAFVGHQAGVQEDAIVLRGSIPHLCERVAVLG